MCRVLQVSRSGYYAWKSRPIAARTSQNQDLTQQIQQIHTASRGVYGSPRVHAALRQSGVAVGRHRVARLMRKQGLRAYGKSKFRTTTISDPTLPVAENRLARQFKMPQPDQTWVGDITYIWTQQGWLYLAVVIDLFSRRVVGWSMAEHLRTSLVLSALQAALGHRLPSKAGLMFHSDRGCQYASGEFQAFLEHSGLTSSMIGTWRSHAVGPIVGITPWQRAFLAC